MKTTFFMGALFVALSLAGCGAGPATSTGVPSAPGPAAPVRPEAAARAKACAAVVSVTVPQRADLLFGERHVAVLVDLDSPVTDKPAASPGVIVRSAKGLERVERAVHVIPNGPFHDLAANEWVAVAPGGGVARVVVKGQFGEIPEWRKDEGPVQHHTHLHVSLTSVIGPYVSVQRQVYQVRENGFMDKPYPGAFSTKHLDTSEVVTWPAALLREVDAAVDRDVADMNERRRAEGKPTYEPLETVDGQAPFGFAFGAPGTGEIEGPPPELTALTMLYPEQAGGERMKRAVEIVKPPAELGEVLTFDPEEPGLVRAPNECGSVGVRDGHIVRRRAGGSVEQAFSPRVDRLVAVTWLGDGEIAVVGALPVKTATAEEHASQAHRLYTAERWDEAREEMRKAAALEPENPVWLRDLARFLDRYSKRPGEDEANLAEGFRLLEKALPLAKTKELRASIQYRMGELWRWKGDKAEAKKRFEASLAEAATDPARSALSD